MAEGFRASMAWLHTWAGIVLGGLLFAIFWMGTLAVFDREIDRWMMPATRLALPPGAVSPGTVSPGTVSYDALAPLRDEAVAARAPNWSVVLPTGREPYARVLWRTPSGPVVRYFDGTTGAALPDPGTRAGSGFLYPFHTTLHLQAGRLGIWLVGVAGMAMLALCVSGVAIHRKLFADFFTVRPERKPRRLILDLHNAAGVLGLPFHVAITLSGLVIFWATYFPANLRTSYPTTGAFVDEASGGYARPRQNRPAPHHASLDDIAAQAERLWGERPRGLSIRHPGDAGAVVQAIRSNDGNVSQWGDIAYFDAVTGALLHQRPGARPVMGVERFVAGFHLVRFRHWSLRWLYFGLGLAGCATIATGYLFWLEARRRDHARLGLTGVRVVEGLAVGSVAGIVMATLAFFVANRVLPPGAAVAGQDRAALEIWIFSLVWLASFAHAWRRPAGAWRGQCLAIAALALAAVAGNWITTGDHPGRSLVQPFLWPVAGVDLLLLATAAVALLTARSLGRDPGRRHAPAASLPGKEGAASHDR